MLPILKSSTIKTLLPLCCLLAISCLLHCSVFKVQASNLFQGQIEMLTLLSKHFNLILKRSGGDKRNRTAGLLLARQALSQLSYTPTSRKIQVVGPSGLEPPTSRLSVVRSSQLSYGPLSSQSPFRSGRPCGHPSLHSLAPPLPREPASLGFARSLRACSVYPLN